MTQDELWETHYQELMTFMKREHRRPSKVVESERGMGTGENGKMQEG